MVTAATNGDFPRIICSRNKTKHAGMREESRMRDLPHHSGTVDSYRA